MTIYIQSFLYDLLTTTSNKEKCLQYVNFLTLISYSEANASELQENLEELKLYYYMYTVHLLSMFKSE